MIRHIDNWKDLEFIAATLALVSQHHWNSGEYLRPLLKAKRKQLRRASEIFDDTRYMPCGYQDAAGDRCEQIGSEYMQMVHAYLACRYGQLTHRLTEMVEDSLPVCTADDLKALRA